VPPLLEVQSLTTRFVGREPLTAVNDVSFALPDGRVLVVLGESGSGKSVLLRSILRLLPQGRAEVRGAVQFQGRDLLALPKAEMQAVRGNRIAMVFQEPLTALDPVYTVGDQIGETLRRHERLGRAEARARTIELLRTVGIPAAERRVDNYPFEMSGGMRQRVVIALALACRPALLLADEPTTALDVTIQAQILALLQELCAQLDMGLILVTHDIGVAAEMADEVAVMYAGRFVEHGPVEAVLHAPAHPYTQGLIRANVRPGQHARLEAIVGQPPRLSRLPPGCAFGPRCPRATDTCRQTEPPEHSVAPDHTARCIHIGEPSVVSNELSALGRQPSATNHQPSAATQQAPAHDPRAAATPASDR
jgi:peptide/nickel transport system ATP-binding protein